MESKFTNPFRYIPSQEVIEASMKVISFIDKHFPKSFSEGKMLGVLVVRLSDDTLKDGLVHHLDNGCGFLAAFSGTVDGKGALPYFVPPIFDITEPGGYFRKQEAEITELNGKIASMENSHEYRSALESYEAALRTKERKVAEFRSRMAETKRRREERRAVLAAAEDPLLKQTLEVLARESQFEKAELKRLVRRHDEAIVLAKNLLDSISERLDALKTRRQTMSDNLQQWIFRQYVVTDALGEKACIADIFHRQGLTPPGGTGDCAAPKLLQYAFTHGLEPVSMGEFWYGNAPVSSVRAHGHFYPSCQHKCGPLLGFMLRGLEVEDSVSYGNGTPYTPNIIFMDDFLIVAYKPSGMLSEPGRNGGKSLQEHLAEHLTDGDRRSEILTVHRLDMDTSGVILYAMSPEAQCSLQRQFEDGSVRKTYLATLCPPAFPDGPELKAGDKGTISLPLASAYEERPRQKADRTNGKPAVTEYEVLHVSPSGEAEVVFHPLTGRTHQLRIHSAHREGLGRPIKGDLLYGGCRTAQDAPLHLRASSITFQHPATGEPLTIGIKTCK